ncbi:MAG: Plug domain-containing protein [bacterium]|nr:Plug domain-containing protein [bacterium]
MKKGILIFLCGFIVCFFCVGAATSYAGQKKGPDDTTESDDLMDIDNMSLEDLLNTKITVASKRSEDILDAPGSVTVIRRSQIQDMNAATLRDVLNVLVPGMDVVPTYFRYGDRVNEGIYSRGLLSDFSQQVLVLYNGQTKYNETTFSSPFPAIEFTLDNIERIEISRTPIPLYGGNAINIINLVPRDTVLEGVEGSIDIGLSANNGTGNWP